MFNPKDPEEEITLPFDFSNRTISVTNPIVVVSVYSGTDPTPTAIISGAPQIVLGNKITQKVIGGLNGVNYLFRVKVTAANGDKLVSTNILPVRTFPYIS